MNIEIKDKIIKRFYKAIAQILRHEYTHYWFAGGRGSTKSSFISIAIILLILNNRESNALVLRKVGSTMKDSVYNQILWAIDTLDINEFFKPTVSPLEITYLPTGQKIYFRGADEPIKIKSIKPKKGYIGITWFEELDQFKGDEEIRNILQSANRGGDKYWNFYSFNPPKSRDNWVNIEIEEEYQDKFVMKNTYLDVPKEWLGEQFILEAEKLKERKPQAYEHEYMGVATGTGGAVFDNITSREITDDEISKMERFWYGIDFGFSIDPLAFCKVSYDRKKNIIYLIDEIYEVKMSNSDAVRRIKQKAYGEYITADSAEPRTINEFCQMGLRVLGAKKGKDSVNRSMKWLQDLDEIVIDKRRTPNAYKEFTLYEYDMDRNGNYISRYPDKNNHYIDSVRYALESEINKKELRWG